jgi:glycosyltransferase involved in cell wall biosynthesis
LEKLITQTTGDLFTYSVVVADNDPGRSAEPVVAKFSATAPMRITYCVEPQQNIALVRNRALQHADGDLIAFIDDDEFPVDNWLLSLVSAYKQYGVDGVLGPVKPYFEHEPPQWVRKGGFFERPNHATGYKLSWAECRTGNLLFRKSILDGIDTPFRPAFGTGGEDVDFFRRVIDMQFVFIWCRDAIAYELVPPARCTRSFLLRRALLRGSNSSKYTAGRLRNFLKSVIAVPCYSLALPVLAVCGHHVFLKYLVKLCDHASRLLAFAGWSVVKERQT